MNTPQTFGSFQASLRLRYQAEGVEFDQYDIDSAAGPAQWHEQELLPWALAGKTFTKDVCRSIAKHGIHRLDWFARYFQGSVPSDISISTGLTLTKKGLIA
jgi:hypothetical protein